MVRPDCDIPHQLNGLAKDLRASTDLTLNEVFYESFRRGLADLAMELMEDDRLDTEIKQRLQDLQYGLRED